jgi:hypothetical protein
MNPTRVPRLAAALALASSLSLVACGDDDDPVDSGGQTETTVTDTTAEQMDDSEDMSEDDMSEDTSEDMDETEEMDDEMTSTTG